MPSGLPSWLLPAVIAGVFAAMLIAESVAPLRPRVEPRLRRIGRNLATGAVSFAFMTLLQAPLLFPAARFVERQQIGFLHWVRLPQFWSVIVAILLLDYTLWIWHWANHRVPLLWRFHLAHHVDLDLDSSTALRFHFGELLLSIPVRAAQIAVIGADAYAVALWQVILFAEILFHHSNLRLPRRLETILVRLLVTPRMHGIHHSARFGETNSNWGSILTIWDFLHRTFRFDVPDERIVIGIPAYRDPADVTLGRILALPFVRQRNDWG